jgi:hypothetical protein
MKRFNSIETRSLYEHNEADSSIPLPTLNTSLLKQFMRLALFADVSKIPLRREDFIKKVLKDRSRDFNLYSSEANSLLKHIFGIEIIEIPTKDNERDVSAAFGEPPLQDIRHHIKHSNTYILRNTMSQSSFKEFTCRKSDYAEKGLLFMILALLLIHQQKLPEGILRRKDIDLKKFIISFVVFNIR